MTTLTCHTSGCEADGIPVVYDLTYQVELDDGTTETVTTDNAQCGCCGNPITDITDSPPDGSTTDGKDAP